MYLSRLVISNYRSINELALKFEKGKNVIVGKNNAGKSNIIRAIDLILGENSPSWAKSENITENDFCNGNITNPIYIFCELIRDENENLNYDEIYKCFGYKYHARITGWSENRRPIKEPELHTLPGNSIGEFIGNLDAAMNISEDDDGITTDYVNPKLRNQGTFESQLNDKYIFAFAFRATCGANGKIQKEIRFFYRQSQTSRWVMAFSAPVRNELLQSAIIHSFRDPQNELRINQWSWFGKLLKNYIHTNDPELRAAFDHVRNASDGVFRELQTEINDSRIQVAFPDTEVSFRFNPESKLDIYKSALIYVNDGYNSLLQDKGSGIQSAVIIGLFNFYTSRLVPSSSLLAVEEPEIYLHPQARRVISHRIDDFLNGNRNQVIITTHSTEFITSAHEYLNIIVVSKKPTDGTIAKNAKFESSQEKQILVKVQNAEMFFADKVILVEGGDKYILESAAKQYGRVVDRNLGENWLNEKNISIISVGGKSEFSKYVKKLKELGIECYVMADFDFFIRLLPEFLNAAGFSQEKRDELNTLKGRLGSGSSEIPRQLIGPMQAFNDAISAIGLALDLSSLKKYIKQPFLLKRLSQYAGENQELIRQYLNSIKTDKIFVLSGELEDFYSATCKSRIARVSGKEEKAIYIVSQLVNDAEPITDFIRTDEYYELLEMVAR